MKEAFSTSVPIDLSLERRLFWTAGAPESHAQSAAALAEGRQDVRTHEELLLNWFRAKGEISNGVVEGLNNKIRVVTRRSYGFRTYEALEFPSINLRETSRT